MVQIFSFPKLQLNEKIALCQNCQVERDLVNKQGHQNGKKGNATRTKGDHCRKALWS